MVERVSPEKYFKGEGTEEEGQPQANEYHNHYYYQKEQQSGSRIPEKFIYLGIFVAGLFIGYLMAKGE